MAEPVTLVNGDISPKFSALDSKGIKHDLDEIMASGKSTILYFYPKDNTPGCSNQATELNAVRQDFEKLGITIVGCSPDSIASHQKFIDKYLSLIHI